jgi:phosphate-selective porin OprO and OprP
MKGIRLKFNNLTQALAAVILSSAAAVPNLWAQSATPSPETASAPQLSTRDKIIALEKENKKLEMRLDALESKASSAPAPSAAPAATPNPEDQVGPASEGNSGSGFQVNEESDEIDSVINDEGRHLSFTGSNGKFVFKVGGYMFADFHAYFQPMSNYLLNDYVKQDPQFATVPIQKDFNGFSARKAHISFGGLFDKTWGMDIALESDKSEAVSLGFSHLYAYVKAAKWLEITAGKFSNILSLESIQPSSGLPFMEGAMVLNLAPNKDVGILISGNIDHTLDYGFEIANGSQDNESSSISPQKAEQNGKALTARIFLTPFEKSGDETLAGLGFGIAGSYDNETNAHSISGSDISPPQSVPWPSGFSTSLGGNEFAFDGGVGLADGDFYHWDPQFYWFYDSFGLQGEYIQSIQTVVAGAGLTPVQLTNSSGLLEAYFDLGGKAGFEQPTIDHPFNLSKGDWGDLEIVARFQQLNADVKAFAVGFPYDPAGSSLSTGAQQASAYGLGVNWWFNNNFKLMLDFERTDFSGGNAVDANGKSTIPSEQVIFSRAAVTL